MIHCTALSYLLYCTAFYGLQYPSICIYCTTVDEFTVLYFIIWFNVLHCIVYVFAVLYGIPRFTVPKFIHLLYCTLIYDLQYRSIYIYCPVLHFMIYSTAVYVFNVLYCILWFTVPQHMYLMYYTAVYVLHCL